MSGEAHGHVFTSRKDELASYDASWLPIPPYPPHRHRKSEM